jgi:hypothetical protein
LVLDGYDEIPCPRIGKMLPYICMNAAKSGWFHGMLEDRLGPVPGGKILYFEENDKRECFEESLRNGTDQVGQDIRRENAGPAGD